MTTQDEKGYNGWANYETWVTALHIDNDEGSYTAARELVRDLLADEDEETKVEVHTVADTLKEWVESHYIDPVTEEAPAGIPQASYLLVCDLLRAALSEVDWFEIARNYLDEVRAEVAQ